MAETPVRLPSLSGMEATVTELLEGGERFGLELIDASQGRLKRGTIYVTLSRTESKGFVVSRQEERPAVAIVLPRRMELPRCRVHHFIFAAGG